MQKTAAKKSMKTVWSQIFIFMGCSIPSFTGRIMSELMDIAV
jgi:hypothetical protein